MSIPPLLFFEDKYISYDFTVQEKSSN